MEEAPIATPLIDFSIGIPFGDFDEKIHASSVYNENYNEKGCKLNVMMPSGKASAWCAKAEDKNPWIEVDFDIALLIDAVSIQGRGDYNQYVTKFRILQSPDGKHFIHLQEFEGNKDNTSVVKRYFNKPVLTKAIRLQILEFKEHPSLRFDLYYIPFVK